MIRAGLAVLVVMGASACGGALARTTDVGADIDIVSARQAWQRVAWGPAPAVNADELHEARVAIERAERAFRERPDAPESRDLAYIAMRRCELVEAHTGIMLAAQRREQALRMVQEEEARRAVPAPRDEEAKLHATTAKEAAP